MDGEQTPQYIATMDNLLLNQLAAHHQEDIDREGLKPFIDPTSPSADFKAPLARWANSGFQSPFTIFSVQFTVPPVCSDGVSRSPYDYICFLLGQNVISQLESFQSNFQGMKISCLVSETTLSIQVSKD
jgi:hypothetical protein